MREKNVSAPRPGLAWITRLASRLNPQRQTAARAIADTVRPGGMAVFTLSVLLTATAAAGPPPPGPTLSAAQPGDEIRCDGQSCSFGACAAQKLFNDPASTSKYLRITPNIVDGQPRGLRLNGIRPDTWPGQLGLINGDIVVSLNGQELSTPESAVTTYLMLKDAPLIELALLRQGQPLSRQLRLDRHPLAAGECPPLAPSPAPSAALPPATAPSPPRPEARPQTRQAALRSLAKDITCQATRCILHHAVVDRLLSNVDLLTGGARFIPQVRDGQVTGIKVLAVRPGDVWALLGLKNGDLLHEVNQFHLTSPEEALQAYTTLRSASELRLLLDRAGAPLTLTYVLKP